MSILNYFKQALTDERKVLRPYFFPDTQAEQVPLVAEESYLRLRLSRMFLKNRRELFTTQYPVVNALVRFAGLDGQVEVGCIIQPQLPGNDKGGGLADVVTLNQTLLGPVVYWGGDLKLMIGLYAAPAEDWAQRFIKVAEGISQFALSAPLTTAVSMANIIKSSVETSLGGKGLDLKLGLDKELTPNQWLAPGHLVMIAAPEDSLNPSALKIEGGELKTSSGNVYTEHDYIVVAIEISSQRDDWRALAGYGSLWQKLLDTAAKVSDPATVRESYLAFTAIILSSPDLSRPNRNAIVDAAIRQVKEIRELRSGADSITKNAVTQLKLESLRKAQPLLSAEPLPERSAGEMLNTDWIS